MGLNIVTQVYPIFYGDVHYSKPKFFYSTILKKILQILYKSCRI